MINTTNSGRANSRSQQSREGKGQISIQIDRLRWQTESKEEGVGTDYVNVHVFWGRNKRNSKSIHKIWIKNNSPKKKFDPQNTTVPQQLPKIPFFETAMSLVIFIEFLLTSSDCKVQSHFPLYHPCAGHRAVVKPAKASSIQPPSPDRMQGGSCGSCQLQLAADQENWLPARKEASSAID